MDKIENSTESGKDDDFSERPVSNKSSKAEFAVALAVSKACKVSDKFSKIYGVPFDAPSAISLTVLTVKGLSTSIRSSTSTNWSSYSW